MPQNTDSLTTILTGERDVKDTDSQWSFVWSTAHLPTADTSPAARPRRGGRRRLRRCSLILGCLLSMHCRIGAAAVSGSFFVFILLVGPCVAVLANPLRHFEVYLGQWSISGPGRAFRILPMFDGIGMAICINAIVRAICYVAMAAIAGIYVAQGVSDNDLPFTYCRDFDLNKYEAHKMNSSLMFKSFPMYPSFVVRTETSNENETSISVLRESQAMLRFKTKGVPMCDEDYKSQYPIITKTPPYNYFYIEVMKYIPGRKWFVLNVNLIYSILVAWIFIWITFLSEKYAYGKLVYNNVNSYYLLIPWLWVLVLIVTSVASFVIRNMTLARTLRLHTKDIVAGLCDALQVSIYTHAASVGTETIIGKGLNHYALGHIDPKLNEENVWHSVFVLVMIVLNSGGSSICALVNHKDVSIEPYQMAKESTLWVLPMYSKCTSFGTYSHLRTTLIFAGLWFSYVVVAYLFLKTALHIIFEYNVRFVYIEQVTVGILLLICAIISLIFTTKNGLPLLEGVQSLMDSLAMPLICFLELFALMYMYGNTDFVSDMHVSTEENACSTRVGIQWQIIPFVVAALFVMKFILILGTEIPLTSVLIALIPILLTVLTVPARAACNAYRFLKPTRRSPGNS